MKIREMLTPYNLLRTITGVTMPSKPSGASDGWDAMTTDNLASTLYYNAYDTATKRGNKPDYDFYDKMDADEIIGAVVDAYAEDATQLGSENNRTLWFTSANPDILKAGTELLDRLSVEGNIFSIVRTIALYGNDFELIHGSFGHGVSSLQYVEPKKVMVDCEKGKTKSYRISETDSGSALPPWAVMHFCLKTRKREYPYGDSILWNARLVWSKLKMIEDAVVIYRLKRQCDRTIYYIDTGDAGPLEQLKITNRWRQAIKKAIMRDDAGLKQEQKMWSIDTDIFFPKNKTNDSKVDVLKGSANVGDIWDLEFFLNKLFGSLKAPKAYFGFEGEIDAKASLVQQDLRFARGCIKLQRAVMEGFTKLLQIDLAYRNIDPTFPANDFTTRMVPVSFLDESARQELINIRVDTIKQMMGLGSDMQFTKDKWTYYVLTKYGGFSKEDIVRFTGGVISGFDESELRILERFMESDRGKPIQRRLDLLMENMGAMRSSSIIRTNDHIPVRPNGGK